MPRRGLGGRRMIGATSMEEVIDYCNDEIGRVRGRLGDLLPGDVRVGPRDAVGMKEVGE